MSLQTLLFSRNPQTAIAMTALLQEADIRVELAADTFVAVEKATKLPFAAVLVDWAEQPEAGFLLKRARESQVNRGTVGMAIVDFEPVAEQRRDHRLDFLIHRPIVADDVREVLIRARQKMLVQSAAFSGDPAALREDPQAAPASDDSDDPNLDALPADLPERPRIDEEQPAYSAPVSFGSVDAPEFAELPTSGFRLIPKFSFRGICALVLLAGAGFCLWRSRPAFLYLAHTPEGTLHVLRSSVASLFYLNHSGAPSVGSTMTDAQQDKYFARTASTPSYTNLPINVLDARITIPDAPRHLRPAFDFPLPAPELLREPPPVRRPPARIPDSIRDSAPIAEPVVVTVGPAQMMPVSIPPPPIPQVSEPVLLSEGAARGLLTYTVAPVYPAEALPQKLHGAVVLQILIARDGSIQDLKLIRGYFLLGRAAIAAVKQWRFRPYTVNGHPASTQTVITVNFAPPA